MNDVSLMRNFLTWPLALAAVVLFALPCVHGADEAALRAALDRLTGEWTGEVQVKAMDGFVLKTIPAARRATWSGDTLVVETTLTDGSSDYVILARQAIRLGRLEASVTRPSQPVDRYLGEIVSGALVWTNAEGNRRDAREQVGERGGVLVLETASVEPIRALGLSGLVRLDGKYRRPAPVVASEPAPSRAPGLEAEMQALRSALEQERASAASLGAGVDEAERRATAAEGRAQTLEASLAEARAAEARLSADLDKARAQIAESENERTSLGSRLLAAEALSAGSATEVQSGAAARKALEVRVAALEAELAGAVRERDELRSRVAALEPSSEQIRRENERLVAENQRIEQERTALADRASDLERRVAVVPVPSAAPTAASVPAPVVASEAAPSFSAAMRDKLIAEVQQMERRVLELESERNAAREQTTLAQRQLEETRRLRDDTLMRFQAVVSELNATREEKERLARANVSLQSEVRSAQQSARTATPVASGAGSAPATTFDGKTADMVIAALQIIGVTRGDGEDKAILDGRLYRNGDLVEAQLGIVFVRIEGDSLVFQDRRGREYRRRF